MTDENEREAIKCDFEAALAGGCAGHGSAQGEVDAEMAVARQAAREASEAAALAEAETSVEVTPGPGLDWSGRKLRLGIDVGSTTVKLAVLDEDAKLVGTKELTITAELADDIGSADSTAIVNELKLILDQTKDMTDDELREQIKQIAEKYEVTLNDSQIEQLISLCRSLEKLDVSALKEKVEQVQQYIKNIADTKGSVESFLSQAADTVTEFVNKVIDFFKNLFG